MAPAPRLEFAQRASGDVRDARAPAYTLFCFPVRDAPDGGVGAVEGRWAEFELVSRGGDGEALRVVEAGGGEVGVVARLFVAGEALKMEACVEGVAVEPPGVSAPLAIERSGEGERNFVFLRPGDVVEVGEAGRFTVEMAVEERSAEQDQEQEQIQVGSSIPTAGHEKEKDAGANRDASGSWAVVEVDRSIRVDDLQRSGTPVLLKVPVVEETPTAGGRHYDAVGAEDEGDAPGMPDSMLGASDSLLGVQHNEASQGVLPLQVQDSGEVRMFSNDSTDSFAQRTLGDSFTPSNNVLRVEETSTESSTLFLTAHSDSMNVAAEEPDDDDTGDRRHLGAVNSSQDDEAHEEIADEKADLLQAADDTEDAKVTTPASSPMPHRRGKKRKSDTQDDAATTKRARGTAHEKSEVEGEVVDDSPKSDVAVVLPPQAKSKTSSRAPRTALRSTGPTKASGTSPLAGSPTSTRGSHRSPATNTREATSDKPARIAFSNSTVPQKPSLMKFLASHGVKTTDKVSRTGCDVLVVGAGELKKTSKLLMAVALGKDIVTESWIAQSAKAGKLLDTADFVPPDLDGTPHDRRTLFAGRTVFITPALKREYGGGFREIEELAKVAGAKAVISKSAGTFKDDEATVYIGLDGDDIDVAGLLDRGKPCYNRDLISNSILRGELAVGDGEFMITPRGGQAKAKGRTKRRS